MKMQTTPNFYELTSVGGSKQVDIVPGAAAQSGKFVISGVSPRVQDMRNYMVRFWLHVSTVLDTDAAGNAVSWDKLPKVLQSAEVVSPILGVTNPHFHTQGATLYHLISVLALAYQYPQGQRFQIPANVDADYTIDQFYVLPVVNEFLADPLDTAQWTGFYDGGTIEAIIAPSTVFEGDYAGAVIKPPTTLRCLAEALPSPREFLGVPFQWRRRQISGGGSSPLLKNVGGETSLNGVSPGAGMAGLYWLTSVTGIGLGGSSTVDNILSITMDWRSQKNIQNLDGYFHYARVAQDKRTSPIGNSSTVPLVDSATWPRAADGAYVGRPSKDPAQMFLPLIAPGRELRTSRVQRVLGDLQVDFTSTTPFTNPHEFMSLELLEFTEDQANAMATLGLFRGVPDRRSVSGKGGTPGNFRYTPIEFTMPAAK